jgi:cytochrome c
VKLAAPLALLAAAACARAAPPGDAATLAAGERAYQKCYSCHSLEGPDPSTQGPSLKGIVGRPVAAEPGFAYSPAMRAYAARQRRWDREALDAFIADPQAVVPDNEMGFFGVRDAGERRALIEYLLRS